MSSKIETLQNAAETFVAFVKQTNYTLDYSIKSLVFVDRLLETDTENGQLKKNGIIDSDPHKKLLLCLISYVGEIIIRNIPNSTWDIDEDVEDNENIRIRFNDGSVCFPAEKVKKRILHGEEDNLIHYVVGLSHIQKKKQKRWWKFWK